ncbi:hypothetical protein NPA07_03945 [Mycoplasmopsis caviae]|uniref:Lipoprotein n=1 Tax=Mycoplasmopsis caviae TaxID=55603 RepID=A0A3P8KCH0_9BACT|nr:hypothetical protein [Mycoplasmopsis caviae]UUD34937.1 hypothetical protein NPA07_03945 [Mycoplasmopsis caviae]VDR42234.1 Uncharacterised protein [Mycoplasmopsis caviae]
MKKSKLYFPLALTSTTILPLVSISCINPFSGARKYEEVLDFANNHQLYTKEIEYEKLFEEEKKNPQISRIQYLKSIETIKAMHEKIKKLRYVAWKQTIADVSVSGLETIYTYNLIDSVNIENLTKTNSQSYALPTMIKKFLSAYFKDSPFASVILREASAGDDAKNIVYNSKTQQEKFNKFEDVVSSSDKIPMIVFENIINEIKNMPSKTKEDLVNLYSKVINLLGQWRATINGNYIDGNTIKESNFKEKSNSLNAFAPYYLIAKGINNSEILDKTYQTTKSLDYSPFIDRSWIGKKEIKEFSEDPYNFVFKKYKNRLNKVYVSDLSSQKNKFKEFIKTSGTSAEFMTLLVAKILYYKLQGNISYINFGQQKDSVLKIKTLSGENLYFDAANDIRLLQNKKFFEHSYSVENKFKELNSLKEFIEKGNWSVTMDTINKFTDKTTREAMITSIKNKTTSLETKYASSNFKDLKDNLIAELEKYKDKIWEYKSYDNYDAQNNKSISTDMIKMLSAFGQLDRLNKYIEDNAKFTQKWEKYFEEFNTDKLEFLEK